MDAVQSIELYNTLFYVSLTVAALGLISAVTLFFVLDIPTVFALMTGRAQKKTLERMNARNSYTGNLRKKETIYRTLEAAEKGRSAQLKTTDNLTQTPPPAEPETSLLQENADETSVLSAPEAAKPMPESGATEQLTPEAGTSIGTFDVTEETLLVHTNEIIQ